MTQGLIPQTPTPLAVVDDYGLVGKGASEAHYVLAENGNEYIVKGPSFTPSHPTVGGNEWIAACLADKLGLPLLDYKIVEMGGQLFFASSWMPKPTFYPAIDATLLQRCENGDRVYGVVALDGWLINPDRHSENLVVRHITRGDRHLLILNDHSHLLVSPSGPVAIADLMGRIDSPPGGFVSLGFIRDSIRNPNRLRDALDGVESLSDEFIRAVVASTPADLLSASDQDVYAEFLIQRRARLRDLFRADHGSFPNLTGAV